MPKAAKVTKEAKSRAKTFEDVFVSKPEHEHCKQVLASKRIRDACFTGWDTSREPYFPEDKGCYYLAANLEICPTTGREHWQGIACFNTVQPAGKVRGMLGQPTAHVGQRAGELSDCIAYCTKPESRKPGTEPVIKGQPRCLKQVKGERSDLNRAREIIQEHRTWTQVINDRTLCDVLARHPRWAHDVFENRAARPVDEATSLKAFADWQHDVLLRIGCGIETVEPGDKTLWFHTEDSVKMLHLHHLASFCQTNRGGYTFNAVSEAEGVAHRYQSQPLVICLAAGHSPSFNILASMMSGVLPTGKFEGRQQLRGERAVVAVFADHAPPPKLEGITEAIDLDEGDTEYENAE
tara:strand:+ start:531 stop:1583 length:1053 start_codon:yes stop_codon:yes gene_type:complete